ncbi:MAG: hypothetical protein Q9178_007947 [Gyalolechia marmorata]
MASPQRLNVLVSRARNALIPIGNAKTFLDARKVPPSTQRVLHVPKLTSNALRRDCHSDCGTTDDVRESKEIGSQDEHTLSPSESKWDRQKRVGNASNGAIDSLMKMTSLEEVKAQVLKIRARADTGLKQNTNMKDERYGIVLLGNPGVRSANASVNCRVLFEDILGGDELVGKLEGFVQTSSSMRARGIDPREHIPFKFIFKGPPDLVAGYVGLTGPKTIQLLEKALGKVLFVDEAYRLGEGAFAAEAINELADSLTKPRFAGKIIVIFAGYEDSMNELLSVTQGLSSRFSEVIFTSMEPKDCWTFLQQYLEKIEIAIDETNTCASFSEIISLSRELSSLHSWGSGRDVQTISKSITSTTFRTAGSSTSELTVSRRQIVDILTTFLAGRRARSVMNSSKSTRLQQNNQATQDQVERPNALKTKLSTTPTQDVSRNSSASVDEPIQVFEVSDERDIEINDNTVATAGEESRLAAREAVALAKEVKLLATQEARDVKLQEFKRRHEEARLKELVGRRAKAEADERLRKIRRMPSGSGKKSYRSKSS